MYYNSFSTRLKEAMSNMNMKQKDLINKTNLDKSLISNYLSGKYKPKEENLKKIADALNVDVTWLMGYDTEDEKAPKDKLNLPEEWYTISTDYNNLEKIKENLPKGIYDYLDLDFVYSPNSEEEIEFGLDTYSNDIQLQNILHRLKFVKSGIPLSDSDIERIIDFIKDNKEEIKNEIDIGIKEMNQTWKRFTESSLYKKYIEKVEKYDNTKK